MSRAAKRVFVSIVAMLTTCTAACAHDESPLHFRHEGARAFVNGTVKTRSFEDFETFITAHPGVKTLVFQDMPGSSDDDTNLRIARAIRARGLHTHAEATSDVNSGAVDLYLAGVRRTAECGAIFGVHSWYDSAGYGPRDLPRDPAIEDHAMFIAYYEEMGIGEDLYWFTVDAAAPEEIYPMTPPELERYRVVTEPMDCEGENGSARSTH